MSIRLIGFDADDTLWRSEDYYRDAQARFEAMLANYVDVDDVHERLYAIESRNIALFGYGVKGMSLSMLEAAYEISGGRVSAEDLHRIVLQAKQMLRHPVELIPGIREAVAEVAADFPVVLITKGDLFHQESKVRESGLADAFGRIEIVSDKDAATYARLFREFEVEPREFLMVGNSLRSDIVPVLALGGWGVHMPYRVTWAHEQEASGVPEPLRFREIANASELPGAVRALATTAQSAFTSPNRG
jgi:putative hydrolase of the HAD superfamily